MDKKEKKTGVTILLLMVIAMAILAATEGWLQDSTLHEAMLQEESMQDGAPDADSLPVPVPESVNEYPGIIRFHVIANSNSQKDQNIKYMVRNHVFCKLENQLTAAMLQAETRLRQRCGGRHRKASGAHSLRTAALPERTAQTARAADRSAIRAATSRAYIKAHLSEIEAWAPGLPARRRV